MSKSIKRFGGGNAQTIKNKDELLFFISEDAKANNMNCSYLKYLLGLYYGLEFAHAFRYLKAMRHFEYHLNNKGIFHRVLTLYYKVKTSRLGMKYNLHITPNVCGYGLRIYHLFGGGHILNVEKVGNYCSFNAGVVLGNNGSDLKPVLGNNVILAPGAKIFGNVKIGDNVFVAANSIVTKDIPNNSVVVGVNRILDKK